MLFLYGQAVTGNLFYDRLKMQKNVKKFIESNQSFMLKAPRRYGKTSLIKHVYETLDIDYFYIDFRKTPRLEILNEKLIDYVYSKAGIKGAMLKLKEGAMSFFSSNKTTVKVNLELFEASVDLFSKPSITQAERLVAILDKAEEFAKDLNVSFNIVMDEFQDVKKLHVEKNEDILEMMRGSMQHHNHIRYSFLGSHMTLMTDIFENKKSPFFNFCRKLKLEAFDVEEILPKLKNAFKKINTMFEDDNDLREVLIKLNGHPANTIMVMQNLEYIAKDMDIKLLKSSDIQKAYEEALEESSDLLGEYIKEISTKEHLHDVIYRMANNENQILEAKSIYQKYSALCDMGYIRKVKPGYYEIIDGFLRDELKS